MDGKNIDLWLEPLAAAEDVYQRYWTLLDEEERAKALRFVQEQHRIRYVISHGKVRTILARYIDRPPEAIRFAQEAAANPIWLSTAARTRSNSTCRIQAIP